MRFPNTPPRSFRRRGGPKFPRVRVPLVFFRRAYTRCAQTTTTTAIVLSYRTAEVTRARAKPVVARLCARARARVRLVSGRRFFNGYEAPTRRTRFGFLARALFTVRTRCALLLVSGAIVGQLLPREFGSSRPQNRVCDVTVGSGNAAKRNRKTGVLRYKRDSRRSFKNERFFFSFRAKTAVVLPGGF